MKNRPNIETPITLSDGGTGASDAASARANLGAQEQSSLLTDIGGLTVSPGDLFYVDGSSNIVRLPKGNDGQSLVLNNGTPTWSASATPSYRGYDKYWRTTWSSSGYMDQYSTVFSSGSDLGSASSGRIRFLAAGTYRLEYHMSGDSGNGTGQWDIWLRRSDGGELATSRQTVDINSSNAQAFSASGVAIYTASVNDELGVYLQKINGSNFLAITRCTFLVTKM